MSYLLSHPISLHTFGTIRSPLALFDDLLAESRRFGPFFEVEDGEGVLTLTIALPGVKREEVNLRIGHDGVLDLEVKRTGRGKPLGFTRSLTLGDEVDPGKVSAKLEDGVLAITVEKRELPQPRSVPIT